MFAIERSFGILGSRIMTHRRFLSNGVQWKTVCLTNRKILRIKGDDAAGFLQGLITQDINTLVEKESKSIYCMCLNVGGRVIFDSIISLGQDTNEFLVDVDANMSKVAVKHLSMYKVRRKILIENVDNLAVHSIFSPEASFQTETKFQTRSPLIGATFCDGGMSESQLPSNDDNNLFFADPRLDLLGYRFISSNGSIPLPPGDQSENCTEASLTEYTMHRYCNGVAEGRNEIVPGKALPLENNLDYLHGVSFHKGCYIGQELTARTHHTGVIRKRILPIKFDNDSCLPDFDTDIINENDKSVGKVRAAEGHHGLALVRLKEAFAAETLTCNGGSRVSLRKPVWWPPEKTSNVETELR